MDGLTSESINGIIIFIILILQLIGVAVSVVADDNLGKKRRTIMAVLLALVTLLVLQNYAECILVEYCFAPTWRTFVAAFGYSVRPAIILLFVYMIEPEGKHRWAWIVVGLNAIMHCTAFFTDIVFQINDQNSWGGGPLNDLCLIVSAGLLLYHLVIVIKEFRNERKSFMLMPILFALLVVGGIVLDGFKNFWIMHWVDYVTIAVVACCSLYYLWLHFIFVRRYQDALLTEQRFYAMLSQIQPHFIYNSLSAIAEIGKGTMATITISDEYREAKE